MITEDYCSFEVARLLKEKGFNEMTELAYGLENGQIRSDLPVSYWRNSEIGEYKFSCPTHQMAMKWLRKVHNKYCDIGYDIDLGWFFQIIDLKETVEYDYTEIKYYHTENETGFNSYEEAVEAALKYCLENLI